MKVREVDPRDTTWEMEEPEFRVYFWKLNFPSPGPGYGDSFESMEYEVSEADVKEVIRWADEYAEREGMDRGYTLHLRVDDKYGAGLVKLFGVDPTAG